MRFGFGLEVASLPSAAVVRISWIDGIVGVRSAAVDVNPCTAVVPVWFVAVPQVPRIDVVLIPVPF